jgi:hypothetical protein
LIAKGKAKNTLNRLRNKEMSETVQEYNESFELFNEWLALLKADNPGIVVKMEASDRQYSEADDGSQECSFERVIIIPPQIEQMFQAGVFKTILAIDAAHSQVGTCCAA